MDRGGSATAGEEVGRASAAPAESGFVGPMWRSIRGIGGRVRGIPDRLNEYAAYRLVAAFVVVYAVQVALVAAGSPRLVTASFTLSPAHPWRVWTWTTHVFAHGNIVHLAVNSVVMLSFGPFVERRLGARRFVAFFAICGTLAGLVQIALGGVLGSGAAVRGGAGVTGLVGASGGLAACVGLLTAVRPELRVLAFFVAPISLWRAFGVFFALSAVAVTLGGPGYLNIAHAAHLTGLVLGVGVGAFMAGGDGDAAAATPRPDADSDPDPADRA